MQDANCATSMSNSGRMTDFTRSSALTSSRLAGSSMWKDSDPRESDSRDPVLWDARERADDVRDRGSIDPRDVFREGLDLPRGRERERVFLDGETLELRGSEVRTLATIGAFRVVPIDELH